jgi:hypothetical protein
MNAALKFVSIASAFLIIALTSVVTVAKPKSASPTVLPISATELRVPKLMMTEGLEHVDLGDGFWAANDAPSILVHIPGAYMDKLDTVVGEVLTKQLAIAAFNKVANAKSKKCISMKTTSRAGEDVTYYYFQFSDGKIARVFVYLNDLDGLLAVMERVAKT